MRVLHRKPTILKDQQLKKSIGECNFTKSFAKALIKEPCIFEFRMVALPNHGDHLLVNSERKAGKCSMCMLCRL